jgi:Ca2+-transporting ATPase
VLLAGHGWLAAQGWSAAQSRSVVFGTLMVSVMLLILANRNLARPALRGMTDANPLLWRMVIAMGLLLAAVLSLPWLRQLMGLAQPGLGGLAAGAALLALCLVWLEGVRQAGRWLRGHAGRKNR